MHFEKALHFEKAVKHRDLLVLFFTWPL